MQAIGKRYEKRYNYYKTTYNKLLNSTNKIANLRLGAGVIAIINGGFFLRSRGYTAAIIFILSIGLFSYLVINHHRLRKSLSYMEVLRDINLESIKRMTHQWLDLKANGNEFINDQHRFSSDLDIFGQGSLYQFINHAATQMGKNRLAEILQGPEADIKTIKARQEAVEELSKKKWWMQRLEAEGRLIKDTNHSLNDLFNWGSSVSNFSKGYVLLLRLLPAITITSGIVSIFIYDFLKLAIFFIIVHCGILLINMNNRSHQLSLVYKYKNTIKTYSSLIALIEKQRFKSQLLKELQGSLKGSNGQLAMDQLKRLETITNTILNRNNLAFFPLNIALLWDYQCLISLNEWKQESGSYIRRWLEVVGEFEVYSSLANIRQDYPHFGIPEITEEASTIIGEEISHPLLLREKVTNSFHMGEAHKILLITGSNMSGKSTFLRTVGVNLVLAYCGAPIWGNGMKCSIMEIHTCMRISDNLEKNISSFYGELLRIKEIVEATKKTKQVFFLIDEVFKGTNSYDRHIGAKALIKELYNNGGVGLVSTHDLELAVLQEEMMGGVFNYHFQEEYRNNEIYFDYKLKLGVSKTRNALYFINMMGIKVKELKV